MTGDTAFRPAERILLARLGPGPALTVGTVGDPGTADRVFARLVRTFPGRWRCGTTIVEYRRGESLTVAGTPTAGHHSREGRA